MSVKSIERLRHELASAKPFRGANVAAGTIVGGHLQTLMGHFLPTRKIQDARQERIELALPEGDTLIGFLSHPKGKPEVGLLHIFHGLAGSSESSYMPRAANGALDSGFAVVLWNHRGCGPGRGHALEPYHSGRSDDLARVVKWGRERSSEKPTGYLHGVLGYSLSANATCLLAARAVPAIDSSPLSKTFFEKTLKGSLPDFAIAVNPPFDLNKAAERLSHGPSRVYGQNFMPALLESLDDRIVWRPENEKRRVFRNLALRAREKLTVLTDVGTFDATYTGPAAGFRDNKDYYERCSSGQFLEQAQIPLVVLSADDDPITHGFKDLPPSLLADFNNPNVLIDAQKEGGHMGYVDTETLLSVWKSPKKNQSRWLERRIKLYLKAFLADSAPGEST